MSSRLEPSYTHIKCLAQCSRDAARKLFCLSTRQPAAAKLRTNDDVVNELLTVPGIKTVRRILLPVWLLESVSNSPLATITEIVASRPEAASPRCCISMAVKNDHKIKHVLRRLPQSISPSSPTYAVLNPGNTKSAIPLPATQRGEYRDRRKVSGPDLPLNLHQYNYNTT